MMFGKKRQPGARSGESVENARPVSWHPTSSQAPNIPENIISFDPSIDIADLRTSYDGANTNPEPQPRTSSSSYASSLLYQSPDRLDQTHGNISSSAVYSLPATSNAQQMLSAVPTIPPQHAITYHSMSFQPEKDFQHLQLSEPFIPTDIMDGDFLPIQHPPKDLTTIIQTPVPPLTPPPTKLAGKVLVGMGLYDPPEPRPTIISASLQGPGKGLILEQTWQPPSEHDDAEPMEDGDSDDEASDDELPSVDNMAQADRHVPVNLSGHSFFFEDESLSNDWWLQQLRYSGARDVGLGYRWS